jgi:hypothetical protein
MSYKGLSASRLETPRNFTDRIYLTDIVETLWKVISGTDDGSSIKLLWRKRYFPWRISITLPEGSILLLAKLLGDSSWTSVIEMQFSDFEGNGTAKVEKVITEFVVLLGRPPYESQYWNDNVWSTFVNAYNISRNQVEGAWTKYVEILDNVEE